jgi:excisionase family DNA binding protein
MTPPKARIPAPRVALSVKEAADALGLSLNEFTQSVMPSLRVIRVGRRRLVPLAELEKWTDKNAARPLRDED